MQISAICMSRPVGSGESRSPQVSAVEGGDDVGTTLDGGLASLPGLPGRVHHGPWHHVQLLGVVEAPPDLHWPVLQVFQFHWAAGERGKGRARGPAGFTGLAGRCALTRGCEPQDSVASEAGGAGSECPSKGKCPLMPHGPYFQKKLKTRALRELG